MRTILPLLTATLLLTSGCSTKTAFDAFEMDSKTERTMTNLRTATVKSDGETKAVISTIYLNNTDPARYHGDEYFLVALYLQESDAAFKLLLNDTVEPAAVEELSADDPRCAMFPVKNAWNRYYLVRYPAQSGEQLTLKLENGPTGTGALDYQKDAQ